MNNALHCTFITLSLLILAGCGTVTRNALPIEEYVDATFLDRHDLRYWGDSSRHENSGYSLVDYSEEEFKTRYAGVASQEHSYLAVSGGGANGAYGAGALVGWSATGTRPEFTIVTGVSTGALIAPFAFLGPDYDDTLKQIYTTLGTEKVFSIRSVFKILGSDGLVDTTPFSATLKEYVNDDIIKKIATEYRKGRLLLIATTNLDAGRPVIWNIGRIADSGHPNAPQMIRDILRASASIPGAFPPVYLPVEANGKSYDEMHVDGGASAQMFLYPSSLDWVDVMEALDVKGTPQAYLIRNSRVHPQYDPVSPRLSKIAARTIDSLIRTQGVGDAYRIYALADRDGVDVSLTWIPKDAVEDISDEPFDPDYMIKLFEYGYQRALDGKLWTKLDIDQH
ncbi:MAG: patatin-like phospholipase family protein [Halioglobus sp.]